VSACVGSMGQKLSPYWQKGCYFVIKLHAGKQAWLTQNVIFLLLLKIPVLLFVVVIIILSDVRPFEASMGIM
jgi:hypothetical protein